MYTVQCFMSQFTITCFLAYARLQRVKIVAQLAKIHTQVLNQGTRTKPNRQTGKCENQTMTSDLGHVFKN